MQYSHASILETVVDIIRGVPFARVIVATPSIQDGIQLRVELDAVGGLPRALDLVVASEGLTPWVRDAFLALRDPFGRMRLEVRPLNPVLEDREADREVPELLARRLRASVDVDYPALYFEGGNVVSDERWAFVGANTMEYNTADTTIRFRSDLEVRLFHLLGRPVVLVGSQDDPAPLDHLDMLMTPLGRRRVAVGDLRLGLSILDGLSPQRQQQLEELFSARTGMYGGRSFSFRAFLAYNRAGARAEAFDRVAQALEARGFDVVRMPLLTGGLDAGFPVMTYQNVVQDEVGGRRRALVPQYRVEELDAAAREAWRAVGYEPVAVDAFSVVDLVGAVRCLSNVIDRAPSMRPPRASVRPGLLAPPRAAPAPPPPAAIRG